jgi:hypothetical protein
MAEKQLTEADRKLVQAVLLQRDQYVQAHSRVRLQYLHAEGAILNKMESLNSELENLFKGLAARLGIEDPENWRLSQEDWAFIRVKGEGEEEKSPDEVVEEIRKKHQ